MPTLVTWDEFTSGERPQGGTIRETVLSEVVNLVSRRRPLMSSISSKPVTNTFVELLTDTLRSRGVNVTTEGAPATDPLLSQPIRHFVHVQSFAEWGIVSDEQRIVGHYTEDPYTYQIRKSLEQMMNDVEHALHRGSAATGETNVGRQFGGLLNILDSTTSTTFSNTGGNEVTLTEEVLIDLMQLFRDNNLDVLPTQLYVNSWLKRTVSEFSTRVTRNVDAAARVQELIIERHTSDFGDLDVMYSEDQLRSATNGSASVDAGSFVSAAANSMTFIDPQYFDVGWLRPPTVENLPRDGFRDRYQINGQATLLFENTQGGGNALQLVPYIGQA